MENIEDKRYIGVVRWFHDKSRDANFGFIEHPKLGDIFFHERTIEEGQDLEVFKENVVVVFKVQYSKKHEGKLEGIGVKELNTECDLHFLFSHFLSIVIDKGIYSSYNYLQNEVHNRITYLLENDNSNEARELILTQFSNYLDANLNEDNIDNEQYIKSLLKISNHFFKENHNSISKVIGSKLSPETNHKFWLKGLLVDCSIEYISDNIFTFNEKEYPALFKKCTSSEKSNILFRCLFFLEKINSVEKILNVKVILNLCKEYANDIYDKFIDATLLACPDYTKLVLWLEDYHHQLDFHTYKIYVITLPVIQQKRFVKKVLKYVHEGKLQINLEDLTNLNVIDYETSLKDFEMGGKGKLDYSISIILNVIQELKYQTLLETRQNQNKARQRIVDIIIRQIMKPDDLLSITGFFDECDGRCSVSLVGEKDENGRFVDPQVTFIKNENNKPKRHVFCDGRKMINRETRKPILSEEGVHFWLCANQRCYKPARVLHTSDEWENYSIYDFLTILKVDYNEIDLEIYLSLINKINRFLSHMSCRECKHILRPIRQSNFAFYGVNEFHCVNQNCKENSKNIYITHCLNGRCEETIDSRDSARCKPTGLNQDKCGWYVCNYCHACCSNDGIQRRRHVYNMTGQIYNCQEKGHRDLGEICCDKCGSLMNDSMADEVEYEKMLNWFESVKDNNEYILKYGVSKSGPWFLLSKNKWTLEVFNKNLSKLLKLGFRIPNYADKSREVQLVSGRTNKETPILVCGNNLCENIIDFSSDLEKARAIKSFHNIRFKDSISG